MYFNRFMDGTGDSTVTDPRGLVCCRWFSSWKLPEPLNSILFGEQSESGVTLY